jgi:Protein of unknown function (DUF3822)
VTPAFSILTTGNYINPAEADLYVHLGYGYLGYAVLDKPSNTFVQLEYYHFNTPAENQLACVENVVYASEYLKMQYAQTTIVMDYGNNALTPGQLYKPGDEMHIVELVHGDLQTGMVKSEPVEGWDMVNCYRIPAGLPEYTDQCFKSSRYRNYHSVALSILKQEAVTGDHILVAFYKYHFNVAVLKDGALMLVQSFLYESAEDVSYRLLAIVQQFGLNQHTVAVSICGLVDEHSAMYSELQKYFLSVEWKLRPSAFRYDTAFDAYPPHFFTPIFLAACVS